MIPERWVVRIEWVDFSTHQTYHRDTIPLIEGAAREYMAALLNDPKAAGKKVSLRTIPLEYEQYLRES